MAMAVWLVGGPDPLLILAPAPSLWVGECTGWGVGDGVHTGRLPPVLTLFPHPCPGSSRTAAFDPVPIDALTGPRDSGEKEPCSGLLTPRGSLGVSQDLPALSLASPVAHSAPQLR